MLTLDSYLADHLSQKLSKSEFKSIFSHLEPEPFNQNFMSEDGVFLDREGNKVVVNCGVLKTVCHRKLRFALTHKSRGIIFSQDDTDHVEAQDRLAKFLEMEGYTVFKELTVQYELPQFILKNKFDICAIKDEASLFIEIKHSRSHRHNLQIISQMLLLWLIGLEHTFMLHTYGDDRLQQLTLAHPKKSLKSITNRLQKIFGKVWTVAIPNKECHQCPYESCKKNPFHPRNQKKNES